MVFYNEGGETREGGSQSSCFFLPSLSSLFLFVQCLLWKREPRIYSANHLKALFSFGFDSTTVIRMLDDQSLQSLQSLAHSIRRRRMVEPAIFFLELSKPLVGCMRELYGMSEPLVRTLFGAKTSPALGAMLSSAEHVERLIVMLESDRVSTS